MNRQHLNTIKSATIIGGGTMGCALANLLGENGFQVKLWVHEEELVESINTRKENHLFLPGIKLSNKITATNKFKEALSGAHYIFSVTPSQLLRQIWTEARVFLRPDANIICASKGVESHTSKLLFTVLTESTGLSIQQIAFLSGPSFAHEIIKKQPTAVVIASKNEALASDVQRLVSSPHFRAYTTDDVIGVELGGACKNVIALAVGAAEGVGLGINTRSALITRGLAEISRLAIACGGQPATLAGLAGMGDLVLTCTGHLSRNLQVGIKLGQGQKKDDIINHMKMVAEGVDTAYSTLTLAAEKKVEMPITQVVVSLLEAEISPEEAIKALMTRRLRSEKE